MRVVHVCTNIRVSACTYLALCYRMDMYTHRERRGEKEAHAWHTESDPVYETS